MKTNNQAEVFLFKKSAKKGILFLLLKRIPEKGGFWQPSAPLPILFPAFWLEREKSVKKFPAIGMEF